MDQTGLVLLVGEGVTSHAPLMAAVQHFGFTLETANSTTEGIERVRGTRPELIFYDQNMVELGDLDFAGALDRSGLKERPLVAFASELETAIARDVMRSGADDIVTKDADIERLKGRIAFWMAGGFLELPAELRRRVQNALDESAEGDLEQELLDPNAEVIASVREQLAKEILPLGPGYGQRQIERVCLLGRLSKLILEKSEHWTDYVRFPDHCVRIVRGLESEYFSDMAVLFRRFDAWSCDPRFVFSGVEALRPTREYEWYSSEYADAE